MPFAWYAIKSLCGNICRRLCAGCYCQVCAGCLRRICPTSITNIILFALLLWHKKFTTAFKTGMEQTSYPLPFIWIGGWVATAVWIFRFRVPQCIIAIILHVEVDLEKLEQFVWICCKMNGGCYLHPPIFVAAIAVFRSAYFELWSRLKESASLNATLLLFEASSWFFLRFCDLYCSLLASTSFLPWMLLLH